MKFLILILASITQISLAQNVRMGQNEASYQAEGKMILFQVRQGDEFMRVYLLGKEAAKVNLNPESKLMNVTLFKKGKREKVSFKTNENYYELENVPSAGPYELEMEATHQGETDKARISIGKP
jgi:hypothetical protein